MIERVILFDSPGGAVSTRWEIDRRADGEMNGANYETMFLGLIEPILTKYVEDNVCTGVVNYFCTYGGDISLFISPVAEQWGK